MSAAPWTEAHAREALRRTYEIAATIDGEAAAYLCTGAGGYAETEELWRGNLGSGPGARIICDAARVEREVRRVRALAEGRLVRETVWRVRYDGPSRDRDSYTVDLPREHARSTLKRMRRDAGWTGAIVRVARIRKAP